MDFILLDHRVRIHLVDARPIEHLRVCLGWRVLLAQHLALADGRHGVAAAEAHFNRRICVHLCHLVIARRRYAIKLSFHLRLNVGVV